MQQMVPICYLECLKYTWIWWLKRSAIKSPKRGYKFFLKKIFSDQKSSKNLDFWPFLVEKMEKTKIFGRNFFFGSKSIQNGLNRILKRKSQFRKKILIMSWHSHFFEKWGSWAEILSKSGDLSTYMLRYKILCKSGELSTDILLWNTGGISSFIP